MSPDKPTRQNRVREALGRIYEQQPPYFREYLRRFQEDPTSRVFAPLAEAYRRLGRVDEAIEICREGLEHHPDFHGGRVALAKCYVDKKRYLDAKVELDRVVQAVPENLLAQRLLGDVYSVLKDRSASLHCYKMALLLSPSDVGLAEKVHQLEQSLDQDGAFVSLDESNVAEQTLQETASTPHLAGSDDDDIPPMWENKAPVDPIEPSSMNDPNDPLSPELEMMVLPEVKEDESQEPSPIDELLGVTEEPNEESFKIEHVSAIFQEEPIDRKKEITTETLGDLYFTQGQFDRALRIFEKLQMSRPRAELIKKINACKGQLGVDRATMVRNKKIEALKSILKVVENERRSSSR